MSIDKVRLIAQYYQTTGKHRNTGVYTCTFTCISYMHISKTL